MILVDKEIKARSGDIFVKNYHEDNVQPISYDIHLEEIVDNNTNNTIYDLQPGDVVMVRCQEEIKVPLDLLIRVENKNSLIRLGLTITSPVYNPGHQTPIYIRVENVSGNIITLQQGMAIAQLVFEQLSTIPDVAYNKKDTASFNDENKYRGLGKYTDFLKDKTKKMQEVKDS